MAEKKEYEVSGLVEDSKATVHGVVVHGVIACLSKPKQANQDVKVN